VDVLLTIGEFSKMTYLSVKALRHYHDVGLLEPAAVDPSSGYRLYAPDQVSTAQAIRRFRDLDMPLEQIRTVIEADDIATRNEAINAHLQHMTEQLTRTQTTISSLQALLSHPRPGADVELRAITTTRTLGIAEAVGFDDCSAWLDVAYAELHRALDHAGVAAAGPDGALYADEFFELGVGEVVAFIPLDRGAAAVGSGRAQPLEINARPYAVMLHTGPFADLDQTYGALGTIVAERGIGAPGPIREHYLDDERAEVCWPVVSR
jgi:DNA-binding transcriptional MerR regulator